MSLRTKLIVVLSGVVLFLSSILAVFILFLDKEKMVEELEAKIVSIGQNLSQRSVDYILTDNNLQLYQILEETKKTEPDLAYAYIVDSGGEILMHTFKKGFPSALRELSKSGIRLFRTERGLVKEISFPLLGGSLGEIRLGFSQERINQKIRNFLLLLAGGTSLSLMGGIWLTIYLTGRILKPVEDLTRAAEVLGGGNFSARVKVNSGDELGRLSGAFNIMAARLEKANEEIASVQARLIQTAKLAALGEFATGIAHEINNPLAGVLNAVRCLLKIPYIKKEERRYLELILKALNRIEETMKKLLTFAYQGKIEMKEVDINHILKDTLELLGYRLRKQGIILKESMSRDVPVVRGNILELQQVFINVIKNALDAMPHGGRLFIRTCFLNGATNRVLVEIVDSGTGINKGDIGKIFDPFFTTKEIGQGVGLGLSVSYGIIKRHGGDIKAVSGKKGTSVRIELPGRK